MFYLCALTLFGVRVFCLTPVPDKCQARPPITAIFFMAVICAHYQLYERDVMTKMIFERNVSQKVYSLRLNGEKRPIHVMDKADENWPWNQNLSNLWNSNFFVYAVAFLDTFLCLKLVKVQGNKRFTSR